MKRPFVPVVRFGLVAMGAAVLAAGPAGATSLEDALIAAYINNPQLQAQRAATRGIDEGVAQALSNWRPEIEVTTSIGRVVQDGNSEPANRVRSAEPANATATVSQSLFRGFRTLNATDQAEELVASSRAGLAATEQTILLNAATAFMDVVRDQAVLELNINNEQVLRRQLEATEDRFAVGEITRTDVAQAEARLSRATADRIQGEGTLQSARARYLQIVGEPPIALETPSRVLELPVALDDALLRASTTNPNVVAADANARAAGEGVAVAKGQLLPELTLSGTVTRGTDIRPVTGNNVAQDEVEATLTLAVPIYQKGAVYSQIREAKQTVSQRKAEIDDARRIAVENATRAWENLQTARARIGSFEDQIQAAAVALEGVERESQVGSRTVLDVLDAEQELLDARVSFVRAQRDEIVAAYQLKAAIGALTARNLDLPVEIYNPRENYEKVHDKWFGGDIDRELEVIERLGPPDISGQNTEK